MSNKPKIIISIFGILVGVAIIIIVFFYSIYLSASSRVCPDNDLYRLCFNPTLPSLHHSVYA